MHSTTLFIIWYFNMLLFFIDPFVLQSSMLLVPFVNLVFMQPLTEFALEKKQWTVIFFIYQVERNFKLIITAFCVIWHFSHYEKEVSSE